MICDIKQASVLWMRVHIFYVQKQSLATYIDQIQRTIVTTSCDTKYLVDLRGEYKTCCSCCEATDKWI